MRVAALLPQWNGQNDPLRAVQTAAAAPRQIGLPAGASMDADGRDRAHGHRARTEGRQIFPNLTVRENLSRSENRARKAAVSLARINLMFRVRGKSGSPGSQLSGGEQQMLQSGALMTTRLLIRTRRPRTAPSADDIWRPRAAEERRPDDPRHRKYVERLVQLADRHTISGAAIVVWSGASAELRQPRPLARRLGV
jgi:branched-chain amino acid transport system ATP-binding protein